jgi:hypothetical protein
MMRAKAVSNARKDGFAHVLTLLASLLNRRAALKNPLGGQRSRQHAPVSDGTAIRGDSIL